MPSISSSLPIFGEGCRKVAVIEERRNPYPFKVKLIFHQLPIVQLQIGDELSLNDVYPCPFVHPNGYESPLLIGEVNGHLALVWWSDFCWYRSKFYDHTIKSCAALDEIFPGDDTIPEVLFSNKYRVSSFCNLNRPTFNDDGTPKYIVDDKQEVVRVYATFQKPYFVKICPKQSL